MPVIRCETHQVTYDGDLFDCCPVCETVSDIEREGSSPAGEGDLLSQGGIHRGAHVGDHQHEALGVPSAQG